ncbi:hypothetical protein [Paenibacillus radicis (ex Xue et al. 2023)]|uniref:Spore coat protein n=1 Tax=Paenibacillus radicis (ex Xue et al. 2023) TaxID=2972489 RepID=A0ABT1YNU3_9BACL|nr:hypothetical protein [Paenibacillus radicis (ex Xue et al. 2023)]MCR8634855.1 hypothetical protein [Paenibacillus radicis (ex Xue et al. 2023)]
MKTMEWLSKLIISAIITSMICVASTFWVVNTYVDMILEQYNLKSAVNTTPDWSKFMQHASKQLGAFRLFGNEAGAVDPSGRSGKKGAETLPVFGEQPGTGLSGTDMTNSGGESGKSGSEQPPSTGSTSQRKPPEDAVAVFGHQNTMTEGSNREAGSSTRGTASSTSSRGIGSDAGNTAKKDSRTSAEIGGSVKKESSSSATSGGTAAVNGLEAGEKVVVSGEEFTKKKEQLSTNDKTKIFNLLVKRLPQNEIQHISKLMEDGITASELKEIEQLLQTYMKPEEYSQLLGMIKQQ